MNDIIDYEKVATFSITHFLAVHKKEILLDFLSTQSESHYPGENRTPSGLHCTRRSGGSGCSAGHAETLALCTVSVEPEGLSWA